MHKYFFPRGLFLLTEVLIWLRNCISLEKTLFIQYFKSFSFQATNLNSGFDVDGGDLLDNLRGWVEINNTLVDPQLEFVPSLRTFSARGLTGGDPQNFGGHSDGALDLFK